ncbi:MAG: glycosyltransferase family 2 protein [Lachnospiraceae bacterium]|jgi:GT2 family glycosyltransferase
MVERANNNGYLVKDCRFGIKDTEKFILTGWIVPDTTIEAYVDGKKLYTSTEILNDEPSFMYRGCTANINIHVPSDIKGTKLTVYSKNSENGRKLCYRVSLDELNEMRGPIRLFLDDCTVDKKENFVHVQGWAISRDIVDFEVEVDGKPVEHVFERHVRKDLCALYHEDDINENCGFTIEVRNITAGRRLALKLRSGEDTLVKEYPMNSSGIILKRVSGKSAKAVNFLRYNGFKPFVLKVWKHFFGHQFKAQPYYRWLPLHMPSKAELKRQRTEKFENEVKFSIVVPLYRTPEEYLKALVDSVKAQTYPNWELILSDGSGENSPLEKILNNLEKDSRIKVLRHGRQMGISENTNAAIEASVGDFIVFCDHDDIITPNALYENAKAVNEDPYVDMLYSDEDKIGKSGIPTQPHMKPDFNFDLLCTVNYICHLTVVKRSLLEKAGMLRSEFNGAQDYDFILRCTEMAENIKHIPKILYHWRLSENSTSENPESKTYAFEAGRRAVEEHYKRLGIPATVRFGEYPGLYITDYHWDERPLVSIIIPNKDHIEDLDRCIMSIENKSVYKNYEYVIIENNSEDPETFEYYEKLKDRVNNVNIVTFEGSFNYSAINNFGIASAKGDYLLLLNNDTEIINPDCIEQMLNICMRPDVGCVGARLYYEDNTIQHAGCVIGFGGIAGHCFVQQKKNATGYCHRIICTQNYSAVTAACMMVKKSVFEEVGGFYEKLAVAFNDIDFCMMVTKAGYRIVYDPYAELYHYESKSRGQEDTPEKVARFAGEIETFNARWPEIIKNGDPYYSPNLSLETQDFSLTHL